MKLAGEHFCQETREWIEEYVDDDYVLDEDVEWIRTHNFKDYHERGRYLGLYNAEVSYYGSRDRNDTKGFEIAFRKWIRAQGYDLELLGNLRFIADTPTSPYSITAPDGRNAPINSYASDITNSWDNWEWIKKHKPWEYERWMSTFDEVFNKAYEREQKIRPLRAEIFEDDGDWRNIYSYYRNRPLTINGELVDQKVVKDF